MRISAVGVEGGVAKPHGTPAMQFTELDDYYVAKKHLSDLEAAISFVCEV